MGLNADHLVNVHTQTSELDATREERDFWKEKQQDLQKQMAALYEEITREQQRCAAEEENSAALGHYLSQIIRYEEENGNGELVRQLTEARENLDTICKNAERERAVLPNPGKNFADVSERQKRRQIEVLSTKAQKALWFVETYGLSISGISVTDGNGVGVDVPMSTEPAAEKRIFQNLPPSEQENVEKVLFLMDKFCGSDSLYHEMVQVK